jgi:hypothetical protein
MTPDGGFSSKWLPLWAATYSRCDSVRFERYAEDFRNRCRRNGLAPYQRGRGSLSAPVLLRDMRQFVREQPTATVRNWRKLTGSNTMLCPTV